MSTIVVPAAPKDTALEAARAFAQEVARNERVAAVLALPGQNGCAVWTVLTGDPDGESRAAIYDLQRSTRQRFQGALLDFSVVDLEEYAPGTPWESLVPVDAERLYLRAGASF
jgi:hypothetical protein